MPAPPGLPGKRQGVSRAARAAHLPPSPFSTPVPAAVLVGHWCLRPLLSLRSPGVPVPAGASLPLWIVNPRPFSLSSAAMRAAGGTDPTDLNPLRTSFSFAGVPFGGRMHSSSIPFSSNPSVLQRLPMTPSGRHVQIVPLTSHLFPFRPFPPSFPVVYSGQLL